MADSEYNEDDFITHYYDRRIAGKLGQPTGHEPSGITVPSDHPDYHKQYWEKVAKPRAAAKRAEEARRKAAEAGDGDK